MGSDYRRWSYMSTWDMQVRQLLAPDLKADLADGRTQVLVNHVYTKAP